MLSSVFATTKKGGKGGGCGGEYFALDFDVCKVRQGECQGGHLSLPFLSFHLFSESFLNLLLPTLSLSIATEAALQGEGS